MNQSFISPMGTPLELVLESSFVLSLEAFFVADGLGVGVGLGVGLTTSTIGAPFRVIVKKDVIGIGPCYAVGS